MLNMRNLVCTACMKSPPADELIGFKLGAGVAAAAAAGGVKAHPVVILLAGVVGAVLAHVALQQLEQRCPDCGEILQLVAPLI